MNIDSIIMSRPNKRATYEEMAQYLNEHHAKDRCSEGGALKLHKKRPLLLINKSLLNDNFTLI